MGSSVVMLGAIEIAGPSVRGGSNAFNQNTQQYLNQGIICLTFWEGRKRDDIVCQVKGCTNFRTESIRVNNPHTHLFTGPPYHVA